jgi:hypothetical protein
MAMAQCYWRLCECPDNQPCTEHTGFFCSTFDGATVSGPNEVNDNVTRDAEMALVRLRNHSDEIERLRSEIEAKKAGLERMKADIENGIANAQTFAQRRVVADQILAGRQYLLRLEPQINQAIADLASLGGQITSAGSLVGLSTIVPYTSPTGYCACYQEKLRQLAPLPNKSNAIRVNELNPALTQRAAAFAQIAAMGSTGPLSTFGGTLASVALFVAIGVYLTPGIGTTLAAIVALIGLMAFALTLLGQAISIVDANAQIASARQKMVRLDLVYYRLQSINTCQRAALPKPGTGGGVALPPEVVDENAWWQELIKPPSDE